ncbi:MAG: ATP synthase subunit I [Smithellaceae bacterium]|nr:ATP synthase subunit I [Smithellaceae bacterium]
MENMIGTGLEKKIELSGLLLLAGLVASSYLFMPGHFTLGLLLGGLISSLNFIWLRRDLRVFFLRKHSRGKASVIFMFYLRLTITAALIYMIISRQWADIVGLLVGLSLVVLSIIITLWRERKSLLAESESPREG